MYIIETQKVLDLKINFMASYVIVPENGFYDPKHNLAILDLGNFQVNTAHCKHTWLFLFFFLLVYRDLNKNSAKCFSNNFYQGKHVKCSESEEMWIPYCNPVYKNPVCMHLHHAHTHTHIHIHIEIEYFPKKTFVCVYQRKES